MLDIATVASNGWTYNLESHSRVGHGHVTQNKVQPSSRHHTPTMAVMVFRLLTTIGWKKTATWDSGSYYMQCLLPPMRVEKISTRHFQTMLPVGIVHHLAPHMDAMRGNSHWLCQLRSQGGQPLHLVAYDNYYTHCIATISCRWLLWTWFLLVCMVTLMICECYVTRFVVKNK